MMSLTSLFNNKSLFILSNALDRSRKTSMEISLNATFLYDKFTVPSQSDSKLLSDMKKNGELCLINIDAQINFMMP